MSQVPIGEDEQLTTFAENPLAPSESPKRLLISVWVTMAVLSLFGAHDLNAFVSYDQKLAAIWGGPTGALVSLAETTGITALRRPLEALAEVVDTPHVVLEREPAPALDGGFETDSPSPPVDAHQEPNALLRPTRVMLVGASSIQYYLGSELERRLELYRDVTVYRSGRISTGLARPDMFDWMKEVPRLQNQFKPDLVVGMFGGNDTQGLLMPGGSVARFGTPEWTTEYTLRVRTMVERVASSGAKMVMLGMPSMRESRYSKNISQVNRVTRDATEAAGGVYIATWDLSSKPDLEYQPDVTYEGETGLMRLPDGVHYSRLGAKFVAEKLMHRLEREFLFTATNPALATVSRYEATSRLLKRSVRYLAFVPQAVAPDEKLPVVFLLHGAGGSENDWSEQAHELLQRAAAEHRLIFIAPDGGADSWYVDSKRLPGAQVARFLTKELIRDVATRLPTSDERGVLGISMGGNAALALALRNPGVFSAVSSLSGAVNLAEARSRPALIERLGPYAENVAEWEANSALQLVSAHPDVARTLPIRLSIGKADPWAPTNHELHQALKAVGSEPLFEETEGTHSWAYWVSVLPGHLAWQALQLRGAAQ